MKGEERREVGNILFILMFSIFIVEEVFEIQNKMEKKNKKN